MLKGLITYPVSENLSSVLGLFCIRRIRNHRSTWRTVIPSCWLKLVRESARGILPMRVIHILHTWAYFQASFYPPPPPLPFYLLRDRCVIWQDYCLVHLLSQSLVRAHSNFLSMLNFLCTLKIILVYSKVRFLYINYFIWVYLNCFEYTLKI